MTREEAIKTLQELWRETNDSWYEETYKMAIEALSADAEWIPCSERLPEPRVDVWCNSDMGQMVGYYDEDVETWYGRDYLELMVTAWMPIPKPYKGGDTE